MVRGRGLPFRFMMMLRVGALVMALMAAFLFFVLERVQDRVEQSGRENFAMLARAAFGGLDALVQSNLQYLNTVARMLPAVDDLFSDRTVGALGGSFLLKVGSNALTVVQPDHQMLYFLKNDIEAPPGTAYTEGHLRVTAGKGGLITARYHAGDHRVIAHRKIPIELYPATTEWNLGALRFARYMSGIHQIPGRSSFAITMAVRSGDKVVGLSTPLELVDQLLGRLALSRNGAVVLIDERQKLASLHVNGPRWGHLDIRDARLKSLDQIGDPLLDAAARATATMTEGDIGLFKLAGKSFLLAWHQVAPLPGTQYRLLLLAPLDDLSQIASGAHRDAWVVALIGLAITLPLTWLSAGAMARVLQELVDDSRRIGQLKFSAAKSQLQSSVLEVRELGSAHNSMREALARLVASQNQLLDTLVRTLGDAIDAKSEYTGKHCARVPELAIMLAREAHDANSGALADFAFQTEDQWREFRTGAWLHDCGKITTPEHVLDKATKLEMVYNRLHEIRTRFEVMLRDVRIEALKARLDGRMNDAEAAKFCEERERALHEDFAFIATCNIGSEHMSAEAIARVRQIAQRRWMRHFDDRLGLSIFEMALRPEGSAEKLPVVEALLSDKSWHREPRSEERRHALTEGFRMEVPELLYDHGEVYNLCVERGTLTKEERFKVNEHIIHTLRMLEGAQFPPHLRRVPEYAGTHHETLDGSGYPRGLKGEQLSIPARIMAIADIFEALTASDRPYKSPKPLSESLRILQRLKSRGQIDSDLFTLFLTSGVYLRYAERFLSPQQIDVSDISPYLD